MNKLLNFITISVLLSNTAIVSADNTASDTVANPPQTDAKRKNNLEDTILVTATRSEIKASSVAASLSALHGASLEFAGHNHIQESLLRIPGVNLHRGNGQEYLPSIRSPVLTGAGACGAFLMAEDNIPLRAAGFCNVNELFEAHTEQAQRIEVLRGVGSAFYGSNALHGIINVITPGVDDTETAVGMELGAYDYGRLKLAAGFEDFAFSLTTAHDGGYRDKSGFDQQKISLRHLYETTSLTVNTGLTYTNLNQETAGFITGKDAYKDEDTARLNLEPQAYRDAKALRAWSRFEWELLDQRQWVVTPYLRVTDMDFLQHFLPGDPLEENGQKSVGVQSAYYSGTGNTGYRANGNGDGSTQVNWVVGIDAEYTEGYLTQAQDAPTEGSVFLQETVPQGLHYDYQVEAAMLASFAHVEWLFAPAWKLTAGLRYEQMRYDYDNKMLAGRTRDNGSECGFGGCRYSRPADRSDTFDNWSPKLGLSYQLGAEHLLYANLARGFRAPQATELYRLQREQSVAELDSERVDSVEIGIKGRAGGLNYALAAYAMKKANYIFRDADFFNVSDGKTRHRGIELELGYPLSETVDLAFSGSYARHRYDYDEILGGININGKDIDTAPRHFSNTRIGWNFHPAGRVELEWIDMGAYYLEPENTHKYAGHDLLNLKLSWAMSRNWTVYGRINNLIDTTYAERADYTTFTEERYFPGTPLAVFVGVKWRPRL